MSTQILIAPEFFGIATIPLLVRPLLILLPSVPFCEAIFSRNDRGLEGNYFILE